MPRPADQLIPPDILTAFQDLLAKGLCPTCREPALPKCYSDAGRREVAISGMCEPCFDAACFDALFNEENED